MPPGLLPSLDGHCHDINGKIVNVILTAPFDFIWPWVLPMGLPTGPVLATINQIVAAIVVVIESTARIWQETSLQLLHTATAI